ncbi:cytochrome c biogenesis protein CcdA [Ornithinibacillus gellani]|uniref:cytochrome c biogenesis CcdA family protein n=1 Tax=Ornithinibacillus gellani TaxID=2293253 RepID=UPI000F47F12D|nr:cytochrome c biogenesis protein CcdA [Ornithinibacillus gellani]TQS75469.1 cytochrome c biogenesis protein CcdA [Ornithinibacillus gellani]
MSEVNIFLAFGAGFLSFISPCVLPLFPAFLSYITGMSVSELKDDNKMLNRKSMTHTVFFLLGFSVIFIMMGFGSLYISQFMLAYKELIRQIGAILIIFFGLVIVGLLNFEFLMKNRKISFKNRPAGYFGSFIIGLAFSLGWTPCTGPILGIVITLAASQPEMGMVLMISYVLGFSIPFFVLSFFVGKLNWIKKHSQIIVKVGGYMMILLGIALFFDWMTKLTSFLAGFFNFYGF